MMVIAFGEKSDNSGFWNAAHRTSGSPPKSMPRLRRGYFLWSNQAFYDLLKFLFCQVLGCDAIADAICQEIGRLHDHWGFAFIAIPIKVDGYPVHRCRVAELPFLQLGIAAFETHILTYR